jgi:anti-sigma B factor antagonist
MVDYRVVDRENDHVVLQLSGELAGEYWTDVIGDVLEEHFVDDGVKVIRVDLSEVTFMDNFGVGTLVALHRRSLERGKRFVVQNPRGQVRDKLRVTGVGQVLQAED